MKKNIFIKIVCFAFIACIVFLNTATHAYADACTSSNTHYCLLAPLGNANYVDTTQGIGDYFNGLIKIFIGLLSVLAVVMVVIGGIQYMMSSGATEKGSGKSRIENAVYGILLVLVSYTILHIINPKLVNLSVGVPNVTLVLQLPGGDGVLPDGTTGTEGYQLNSGATFSNPGVTTETKNFVTMLAGGTSISEIYVDANSKRAIFYYKNSSGVNTRGTGISINIGANGYSSGNSGVSGDKKTPLASESNPWHIDSNIRLSSAVTDAVKCTDGNGGTFNCGAAFIEFDSKNSNGSLKHTGFHGNKTDTLASTAGCIRMYNDDLVALGPYMKSGIPVVIVGT